MVRFACAVSAPTCSSGTGLAMRRIASWCSARKPSRSAAGIRAPITRERTEYYIFRLENISPLVLHGPLDVGSFQGAGGAQRPDRIGKQGAPQDHQVCLLVGHNRFGEVGGMDQAHGAGEQA